MRLLAAYLCLAMAVAYAQNITVQVGGQPVGQPRGILDFESGNGILQVCSDDTRGNRITCTPSYNSALISTHDTVHSNENYCVSTNGSTAYTCRLPYKALTAYQAGMTFVLVADATCEASCSLNIDGAGVVNIKKSDGTTDPGGAPLAAQPQWVFYDGKVFRLMGGAGGGGGGGAEDRNRERDVIARRFIASMDTMTYAAAISLEVTAGDLHKTTTNNAVGNATITAITGGLPGQHMWIIIANDLVSSKTVAFGANLRSSGPLTGTPGKSATLQFISDGTAWYEVARTTNL